MEVDNDDDEENDVKSRSFTRPFAQHAGNPHFLYLCSSKNVGGAALLLPSQISFTVATKLIFHATFVIR